MNSSQNVPNPCRRSGDPAIPQERGLYNFENEHDACGVGLIANINAKSEHRIVEKGISILKRLMHRGAAGNDPLTGDGAGILTLLPDRFFRRVLDFELPEPGRYAVAMVFNGVGSEEKIDEIIRSEGGEVLGRRTVPTFPEYIGEAARRHMPVIRQWFVGRTHFGSEEEFERKVFVMRRLIEKSLSDIYLPSFSSRTIVYKGLLLADQIDRFYSDLSDPDFESPLAIVHQRYSTNTFPTWTLAHPFRMIAHNGEINTLRGNLNQNRGREPFFSSPLFGEDLAKILPLIDETQSDSACLDNMVELLTAGGRSLPHVMMMLIPQAWGPDYHLGRDVRGFFDYHSVQTEPWDGPAAIAFTDGRGVGAILDRNGLRPARYTLASDGLFVLASEAGVIDIPPEEVVKKGRLRSGEIIWADLGKKRLVTDAEIKNTVARQKPYRRWSEENRINIHGLFDSISPSAVPKNLTERQRFFGWSEEEIELLLTPMARDGKEPIGSMGNDAALAVLSEKPQSLFGYFKQMFAQVTNPPIDPIRERLVMSLTTYIGNGGNLLADDAQCRPIIRLPRPILTEEDLRRLASVHQKGLSTAKLSLGWTGSLDKAVRQLQEDAVQQVRDGHQILILSDRGLAPDQMPIPSLLAASAVNTALSEAGLRPPVGLIIESGEIREVAHFALLLGFGATAISPYLALETVSQLAESGRVPPSPAQAAENYIAAVDKGLLKIMSKMGISTLRSYRGARIFEAVGLDSSLIDRYFPNTRSRIGGITIDDLEEEIRRQFQRYLSGKTELPVLPAGGQYRYRKEGENHLWTPETIRLLREAVQNNDPEKYQQYAGLINNQAGRLCTLRGLFDFAECRPVPIDEVEPVENILRRFVSGAMSLGSLSPEAHEAIAIAMNSLGGRSNCGEGGEDPRRSVPGPNGEVRSSQIRQVASGRFGVTIDYLAEAKEIQIKMAQGAKPGEGGQLPGYKVDESIARVRHSTPFVTLISPPPHHDIYSIEDLAQLIFDLKNANRDAAVSVKLVSESGVGTIAAGVAKGHADLVLISGHDGGTGASPLTSIKHAGLPWELGLAETQQTLVLNGLRDRVRLQVDGQLKTGRDVIIAALLGAEEFGFATTLLVCLGCVMIRKCHENCCPAGVATQDPELRKRFRGKPEYIVHFLRFIAQEVREYLAQLGLRSIDEAVGRADLLQVKDAIDFYKAQRLDFSKILTPVLEGKTRFGGRREELTTFDDEFVLPHLADTLQRGEPAWLTLPIQNVHRTVGTRLSSLISRKFGPAGLPDDTVQLYLHGVAGQSFGAFLAHGVTLVLEGEVNDYLGKGLSGGRIIVRPPIGSRFNASENVIAGNVIGYGGTSGEIFLNGQAGERFAIRNSGITAVVEGIGDHGCEYMTGGRVVVLGPTGVNFAAGMTGGIAYVYDQIGDFDLRCNVSTVDLDMVGEGSEEEEEILTLLNRHVKATGSPLAQRLLAEWASERNRFVRVVPIEYRRYLASRNGGAVPR
ncbi:MAG: glutamate synthase large subunit [Thermoguttaceae bacterium]|nr:glutamate synthase large subunit [Thermoguttaceae bacterium]